MKIFKIIIFVVLGIGLLVGAMFLVRDWTKIIDVGEEEEPSAYSDLKHEIETDWKDLSQWDLKLYNEEKKKVNNAYSTEQISHETLERLMMDINSNALIAIDKSLPKLMKASPWDTLKINVEMAGIDSVAKNPILAEKNEVVRSKNVYKLYHEIKNWVAKKNASNAGSYYKGSATSWTNFDVIVEQTEREANEYKRNKYYMDFLANKLNQPLSQTIDHVKGLRREYYDAVIRSIKLHYPIENWDLCVNPMEEFQSMQRGLVQATAKLKGEDKIAYETIRNYMAEFNKSRPEDPSKGK